MRSSVLCFSLVTSIGCVSTSPASVDGPSGSASSECVDLYNVSKKNPGLFTGLGAGPVHEVAVDMARADLAKEISTNISSSTTVYETEKSASVSSSVDSRVSAFLSDAKVIRKCEKNGKHEAVVTMHKDLFLASIKKAIESENSRAKLFEERIRQTKGLGRPGVLIEARDFLEASSLEESALLCARLGGCTSVSRGDFDALRGVIESPQIAEELAKANLFQPEYSNPLAEEVAGEIASLLRLRKVVLDDKAPENQIVRAECSEQFFPSIAGTEMRVLELSCRVVSYIDGKKQWSRQYQGRGVGVSPDEARSIARNQMVEVK
jgi:hypothetical protein